MAAAERRLSEQALAISEPHPPRRGEIWTVALPNQPSDTHTPRPALVVSIDIRNGLADDVIVVPLSTNLRPLPTHVRVPAESGGIRQESMAKCEQITTLDKRFLRSGPLGDPVSGELLHRVILAVRRAIGEVLPA